MRSSLSGMVSLLAGSAALVCSVVNSVAENDSAENLNSPKSLALRAMERVKGQLIEAQGRAATTWSTRPGAVSVFFDSGRPSSIYKLYSSPQPVAEGAIDISNDVPINWDEQVARYVDLNTPYVSEGELEFPIADPRSNAEGFSYRAEVNGVVVSSSDDARLPMPVAWLYILADGNEGYLDSRNRFVGSVIPTSENPIVGRYAFWADDNTCKINVNRASEGVYWDTPRVNTEEDRNYGKFQPARGEYQRYPGHPARVCMSSVLYPGKRYKLPGTSSAMGVLSLDDTKQIWKAARGISDMGSAGGTKVIDLEMKTSISIPVDAAQTYSDVEEFAMGLPEEQARNARRGAFMLTTENRSPDTNLLGYPKITTWPVPTDRGRRTPFDNAVVATSTVNRGAYMAQRNSAYSRHNEFYGNAGGRNRVLFDYLKVMASSIQPGYGKSYSVKYGSGKFDDRDQILIGAFNHLRQTNLYDGTNRLWQYTKGGSRTTAIGHGQVIEFCACGGTGPHQDRWHQVHRQCPMGIGRTISLSEIALIAIVRAEVVENPDNPSEPTVLGEQRDVTEFDLQPGQKLLDVGILVEAFAPSQGWTPINPQASISVGGGFGRTNGGIPSSLAINGQQLKQSPDNRFTRSSNRRQEGYPGWGGNVGVTTFAEAFVF